MRDKPASEISNKQKLESLRQGKLDRRRCRGGREQGVAKKYGISLIAQISSY